MRDTLSGLFVEIAIVEHLTRVRVERYHLGDLGVGEFGILGYLIRHHANNDTQRSIAWTFQEDEERVEAQIDRLAGRGYVDVTSALQKGDRLVQLTLAGQKAHEATLERMGPEFLQIVSEIPPEDIATAHRVLREIRLVMDNLPDR